MGRAMPLVAAIQLPAALAYIFDGIFLGARDFRFLGIAMVLLLSFLPPPSLLLSFFPPPPPASAPLHARTHAHVHTHGGAAVGKHRPCGVPSHLHALLARVHPCADTRVPYIHMQMM